jgi:hypothetical protein
LHIMGSMWRITGRFWPKADCYYFSKTDTRAAGFGNSSRSA